MEGAGRVRPIEKPNLRAIPWLPIWRAAGWLLVATVWILSLMPQPPAAPGGDKLHHFIAYFGLMLLFSQWHSRNSHRYLAIALISMGCAIEVIQPLTGSRYFSWLDMLANSSGILVAWWFAGGWPGTLLQRLQSIRWSGR